MTNITKNDLAKFIYQEIGISVNESSKIISDIFNEIAATLASGEDVKISNFGTFKVRDKKARIGRNPKTKQEYIISARRAFTFHASRKLKNSTNQIIVK